MRLRFAWLTLLVWVTAWIPTEAELRRSTLIGAAAAIALCALSPLWRPLIGQ